MSDTFSKLIERLRIYMWAAMIVIPIVACYFYFIKDFNIYAAITKGLESCVIFVLAFILNIIMFAFQGYKKRNCD